MEQKQRKRQREDGKRRTWEVLKATDAWYNSTSKLPPLNVSVDGIACCDCSMCFVTHLKIPSGVAYIKVCIILEGRSKTRARETRTEKIRYNARHFRRTRAGKGKW